MTAPTSFKIDADQVTWDEATNAVNAWRGRAIQCFAQAEGAVSETLLVLAAAKQAGAKVRLRRLVGQRFEDLADALRAEGPFANQGEDVRIALEQFRQLEPLRPPLCHGIARISLDRRGEWVVILKVLSFRGHETERDVSAFEQREATRLLEDLKKRTAQLTSALGSLRSQFER